MTKNYKPSTHPELDMMNITSESCMVCTHDHYGDTGKGAYGVCRSHCGCNMRFHSGMGWMITHQDNGWDELINLGNVPETKSWSKFL